MAENIIFNVQVDGKENLQNLDNGVGKVGKSVNKTQTELVKLRNEIKEAKNAMLTAAEGTNAYNAALRRASDAQFKLKDINDKTRAAVKDFGTTGKNVAQGVAGLAGGFSVLTGTMSLFGVENEFAAQALLKVQSAMAIASGIGQFADSIDNIKDLLAGLKASSQAAAGAVGEIGNASKNAADGVGNLAGQTAVVSSNLANGTAIAQGNNNILEKTKDISDKLSESEIIRKNQVEFLAKNQDKLSDVQLRSLKLNELMYKGNQKTIEQYVELNNKIINSANLTQEYADANIKLEDSTKKSTAAVNESAKAVEKSTTSVGKQLLTMGVWIVVISAVVIAITKLIEWLNKIPPETTALINMEVASSEKQKADIEKIRQFAIDYNVASQKGDKERMDALEKYAKKEWDVNKERLAGIKTNVNAWREAFSNYLKMAKDTYFNEELIKKRTEQEFLRQKFAIEKSIYGEQIKNEVTPIGRQNVKEMIDRGDTGIYFGAAKKYKEAVEGWKNANDELRAYQSFVYRPIDSGMGSDNKPSNSNTKTIIKDKTTTVSATKLEATPKDIDAEKLFWEDFVKRNRTNLEEATQEVSQSMSKLPLIGANTFQLIDADIKLLNAELKDNQNELENATIKFLGYEDAKKKFNDLNKVYLNDVDTLNTYYKTQAELQNKLDKLTSEEVANTPESIAAQKKLIEQTQSQIKTTAYATKQLEDKISTELEQLKTLKQGSKDYEDAYNKIIELGISRDKIEETLAQKRRDRWNEEIKLAQQYLGAFSSFAGGMDTLIQGNMDMTNKEYDAKVWANDEMIQSDKQRQINSERIEKERYEALKVNFEEQKKWKEAQAWMDFASGSVGIWTAPGITSLAPFGYILAGVQEAALLATTIGNVKTIRSQTLDKPHSSKSSSGGSSSGLNIALNPKKEALTSQTEMLNTMNKNNIEHAPAQFVKVSDINNVQNKVSVRDKNLKY